MSLSPSGAHEQVIVIGSGPAGYTAAIYAARAMLSPLVISGSEAGGQLMITTDVENYPGFAAPVQGPWLMEQMRLQAEHCGARFTADHIVKAELTTRPFRLTGESGQIYTSDSVIIATGAKAQWLGEPWEEKFKGYGVSACATCDGFFFRNKVVMVVGGGNSAVEEALYLANLASQVYLVHRRDFLRAEKVLQDRLLAHPKIQVIWNSVIDEIMGSEAPLTVESARLRNVHSGALQTLKTDGVFIAIGHKPVTELFAGMVTLKPNGYIQTAPNSTATNIPGVFAAGDVADDVFRQAVTAAGLGCMAALEAERWLAAQRSKNADAS